MRTILFILIGIIIFGCGSAKNKRKLPPVTTCAEDAKIYDRDIKLEGSKLFMLNNISYSTTYTRMYTRSDSLEKNDIRFQLAKTSERVFKKVFPKGISVDATQLLQKEFSELAQTLAYFQKPTWTNSKAIEKLIVPSPESKLQLFIDMRSYYINKAFSNNLVFYVFDLENKDLVYYDYIFYDCDPRDETMFMKTLYYGMNKLKNSVK